MYSTVLLPSLIDWSDSLPVQSDWSVVQRGYYAHVLGEAPYTFEDPVLAVRELKKGNTVSGARSEGLQGAALVAGCARNSLLQAAVSTLV